MKRTVALGDKFARLTVIGPYAQSKNKSQYHLCLCECGNTKLIMSSNLVAGKSKSCGCLSREAASIRSSTHGMSKSPEYSTWNRMWSRCTNPIVDRYPQYGGRGISVCQEWSKFEQFYSDMGPKPSSRHSIGRIDNNGNYCKSNCRWETPKEQANNTSTNRFVELLGRRLTVSQWSDETGIKAYLLIQRLELGIQPPELFFDGNLTDRPITVDGVTKGTVEWMRDAEIPISSFYHFQRKGMSKEDVVRKYLRKQAAKV